MDFFRRVYFNKNRGRRITITSTRRRKRYSTFQRDLSLNMFDKGKNECILRRRLRVYRKILFVVPMRWQDAQSSVFSMFGDYKPRVIPFYFFFFFFVTERLCMSMISLGSEAYDNWFRISAHLSVKTFFLLP